MQSCAAVQLWSQPGHVLAGYNLLHEVGRGAVARVYAARHVHPGRDGLVALKVVHPDWSADERALARLQLAVAVRHPCIVRIFEAGVEDERMFIAMELVGGGDLAALLAHCRESSTTMPVPAKLHILGEVLKGLAHLHDLADTSGRRQEATHLDISPANVLVDLSGDVKLSVTSLAESVCDGKRITLGYSAPERIWGGEVDQRADVFAAGVLAVELLTERRLFAEAQAKKRMRLPETGLSPSLTEILRRALQRNPANRYASAREMFAELAPELPSPAEGKAFLRQVVERMAPRAKEREAAAAPFRRTRSRPRVLLVGKAAAELRDELDRWGFVAHAVPAPEAAAAAVSRRTFKAMVVEGDRGGELAEWYRGLPGMGHQPVLVLGNKKPHDDNWRTHWMSANAEPAVVVASLRSMLDRMSRERGFVRFPLRVPLTMLVTGRSHEVQTVDISRNGVAVTASSIPALHVDVTLSGCLNGEVWQAGGVVQRVAVQRPGITLVGVELTNMSEACEAILIGMVTECEAELAATIARFELDR